MVAPVPNDTDIVVGFIHKQLGVVPSFDTVSLVKRAQFVAFGWSVAESK
jgi:hypothetical protein